MRPALAINNRRQWAVTQESRGQDKYFENQAPGLMSPTLRRAEKSIFVLNYWQDRPTQRQGENNCIQKNQWMCWAGLRKICSFINLVLQLRRISSCFEPFIRFRIGIIFKRKRSLLLQQKLWNLFIFNVMRCWADPVPCLQTCVMRRRLHHIFPLIGRREVS